MLGAMIRRAIRAAVGNKVGETVADAVDVAQDQGVIPYATLVLSAQPTTGDTVTIGADVYQFRAAAAAVTNNAYIAVEIGASATLTRANLIAAINARDANNAHASITKIGGSGNGYAVANGTELVRAYESGSNVVIEPSQGVPGNAVSYPFSPSIVLAESITDAADVWQEGNVNVNTLGGRVQAHRQTARASLTVTAAMIAASPRSVRFPFTVAGFTVQIRSSTGALRLTDGGDTFAASGANVVCTLAGGAAPDVQATDVVTIVAWE